VFISPHNFEPPWEAITISFTRAHPVCRKGSNFLVFRAGMVAPWQNTIHSSNQKSAWIYQSLSHITDGTKKHSSG